MERPLRILHAVVNMNRGGAETLLMNLYRHMDRSKIQFDFLTSKEGLFDEEILSLGGRIHRIPYIDQQGYRSYVRELNRFFRNHAEYTIVHSHMDMMSGLVLRAAKKENIPVRIAHSHNTRSEGGRAARLFKRYAGSHIPRAATHRFACSTDAADWLFPGQRQTVSILNNGIDPALFYYSASSREVIRAEWPADDGTYVIGHVGRFNHQKNHELLLDIFKGVHDAVENSLLVLVGEGPLKGQMVQKAKDLGLEHKVLFLGIRADVQQVVQGFDAFVFPSHHEGLPVTLIEAQASGLHCYVSNTITSEADLGLGLMTFLSNRSVNQYVDAITHAKRSKRTIADDSLIRRGYDIRATARWLQHYYEQYREVRHENVNRIYADV